MDNLVQRISTAKGALHYGCKCIKRMFSHIIKKRHLRLLWMFSTCQSLFVLQIWIGIKYYIQLKLTCFRYLLKYEPIDAISIQFFSLNMSYSKLYSHNNLFNFHKQQYSNRSHCLHYKWQYGDLRKLIYFTVISVHIQLESAR